MPQAELISAEEVKFQEVPIRREPDGENIAVTSEDGVTEFTFTLTLA